MPYNSVDEVLSTPHETPTPPRVRTPRPLDRLRRRELADDADHHNVDDHHADNTHNPNNADNTDNTDRRVDQ